MKTYQYALIVVTAIAAALSAAPVLAKSGRFDTYSDGARTARYDVYADGAKSGAKFDTFVDGAKSARFDSYSDGARYETTDRAPL